METRGTALLTHEIPAPHALNVMIPRGEIAGVLQDPEATPELYLDLVYGEEQSTVGISWSYAELESLFERTSGDEIMLTFDRNELQSLFDDVEAHGFRERALIFTVAVAGALGSGATIANAAPTIGDNPNAASIAAVENLAAKSIDGVASNVHTPGLQTGDVSSAASASVHAAKVADHGIVSNVHTPGLQTGDVSSAASASVHAAKVADHGIVSNVHTPGLQTGDETSTAPASSSVRIAPDSGVVSNVHTPGLQTGDETSTAPAASSVRVSADDGIASNVHTPGLQVGPGESAASTPAVHVSAGSSSSDFLGIDTRDATEALIAGGVLLAIAGATFAGARRPGSARPA